MNLDDDLRQFFDSNNICNILKIRRMKHGIANKVYKIETLGKNYLLKEYLGDYNRKCKFDLLKHCEKTGINVPKICSKTINSKRTVCLYDFIEGKHKYKLKDKEIEFLIDTILKLDKTIIINDYVNDNIFKKVSNYINILENTSKYRIDKKIVRNIMNQYYTLNFEKSFEYCLVHGDLSYTNLIWNKNQLYIIDFDESIVAPREYEIISMVIKMSYVNNNFNTELAKTILHKYIEKTNCKKSVLQFMWEFYILKVIIEKIVLYQIGKINILERRQKKDSWEKWYELLKNQHIITQLFEC